MLLTSRADAPLAFPSLQACALLTVIPTLLLAFRSAKKARLPAVFLSAPCSILHILLRTPAGGRTFGGRFISFPTATLTLCSAARALAQLASFSFSVSPLRRTPAQLPCYESKGRLFQVCKFEPSSAPWAPKQPPQSISLNFRAFPAASHGGAGEDSKRAR